MKILLVILLTGGLIVGVSYAIGNRHCERAEDRCLRQIPDFITSEHERAGYMNRCMKRGFPQYNYKGNKCYY